MAAQVRVTVAGLREANAALEQLPRATQRAVLRRVLVKAGQPIAEAARALAPKRSGELAASIQVSTRIKNKVGNAEFAAAMAAGLGINEARSALRAARRAGKGAGSYAEVHVGPAEASKKHAAIKRIVQEFGSARQPGTPYMRPAWAQQADRAFEIVRADMQAEIAKAAARVAKRAARLSLKG